MNNKFYVYIYLDPRREDIYKYGQYIFYYEPFYVGKGCKKQYKSHLLEAYNKRDLNNKNRGNYKCNKIRKIRNDINREPIIVKLYNRLTEKEAFQYEIELIKIIGRINLDTGPLTNLTDGGEGLSGYKYPEYLKKIRSDAIKGDNHLLRQPGMIHWNKGKTLNEIVGNEKSKKIIKLLSEKGKLLIGEKNPMFGKKHTHESKKKMSKSSTGEKNHWYGKKFSDEHKRNLSNSLKNCKKLKAPRPNSQGKNVTKTVRKKISDSLKKYYKASGKKIRICGKQNHRSKPVFANFKQFDSMTEAANILGVSPSTIAYRINKKITGYCFINKE